MQLTIKQWNNFISETTRYSSTLENENKLVYAIEKVTKINAKNIQDANQEKLEDFRADYCMKGDKGQFLLDEKGQKMWDAEGEKAFRKAVKEYHNTDLHDIKTHIIEEVPEGLDEEMLEAFRGIVTPIDFNYPTKEQ
jgi:hypothetical protein